MTDRFSDSIRTVVANNKISVIVCCILSVLSLLLSFIDRAPLSGPVYFATGVSALVLGISVTVKCALSYYRTVRDTLQFENGTKFFCHRVGSCLIPVVLATCSLFACIALSGITTPSKIAFTEESLKAATLTYDEETVAQLQELADVINTTVDAMIEKGYTSLQFSLTVFLNALVSIVSSIVMLFSALSFSKLWKSHPLLAAFGGYLILDLICELLLSLIAWLSTLIAPGLLTVSEQLTSFYDANATSVTELYQSLSESLPEASLYVRFGLFSAVGTFAAIFTCALAGVFVLNYRFTQKKEENN